ncbi:MAG TPA: DUF5990 family protein [Ilumatobacteraceae bacterium]
MEIRIEGTDLPGTSCGPSPECPDGHRNIHVGIQRRGNRDDLLGLVPATGSAVTWTMPCTVVPAEDGFDIKGPYIQGPPRGRFIYISWGTMSSEPMSSRTISLGTMSSRTVSDDDPFDMFRRAKLWLEAVPATVVEAAIASGVLVGRLGLTDPRGNPVCASIRPPLIEWCAGT